MANLANMEDASRRVHDVLSNIDQALPVVHRTVALGNADTGVCVCDGCGCVFM